MMDHQFDLVSTPNEKLPGKPAPDHLLHVMAALHCDPTETIYVGDMIVDKLAAQSASVDYLHASWDTELQSRMSTVSRILKL